MTPNIILKNNALTNTHVASIHRKERNALRYFVFAIFLETFRLIGIKYKENNIPAEIEILK